MSYLLSREKDSLREGRSFEMFKSIQQLQINVFLHTLPLEMKDRIRE